MDKKSKKEILERARAWFREEFAPAHAGNTEKLRSSSSFNINPFLASYLANYFRGNDSARALAEVLIYPRILGTSVTTSFGNRAQQFITKVLPDISGSTTSGVDIEFVDQVDGRKKYCQVKAGPNVINTDGVSQIKDHFDAARRLARTNNLKIEDGDFMFCLLYGEPEEKSAQIRALEQYYPVAIGCDFWHRLTGDRGFYEDFIHAIGSVAKEFDMDKKIQEIVDDLAGDLKKSYPDLAK